MIYSSIPSISSTSQIAIGSRFEMEEKLISYKKVHLNQINEIVLINLTTNESEVKTLSCEISPISKKTVRQKLNLLFLHIKHNPELYLGLIKSFAFLITVCVVAVVAAKFIATYLANFRSEILMGKWVYNDGSLLEKTVGLERYHEKAFDLWFLYAFFTFLAGIAPSFWALCSFLDVKEKLFNFFKDPCVLKACIEHRGTSCLPADLSVLSNDRDQDSITDPITLDCIKRQWATAPRFIKIGTYLFSLDSLLKQLFSKKMVEGKIQHPVHHGFLSEEEQEKLLTDLSDLFQIERSEIIKYFNPYYCDWRKIRLENDTRVLCVPQEEKDQVLQEILFDLDLARMIRGWDDFSREQKAYIRPQLEADIFARNRLLNFLREFHGSPVFAAKILKNDSDFFTLEEIFNRELGRSYEFSM